MQEGTFYHVADNTAAVYPSIHHFENSALNLRCRYVVTSFVPPNIPMYVLYSDKLMINLGKWSLCHMQTAKVQMIMRVRAV